MALSKAEQERAIQMLKDALEGLDPMEAALLLVKVMRDEFGGEWNVIGDVDGGFSVVRKGGIPHV